ncbi:hypothetical protein CYMTET_55166 [Cymbomonas tetramitiformis]|uniref:NADAR domain-containing protein n=1 Tax=Cymbomonas tetramitiformis TaxID=36881 RepID=A0AAE0BDV7_9CHLO|nr:hypothetical protein CYMTET_55166 [Cymbomonas tetramitiformis]|eukprot:gene125-179_t
MSTSSKRDSEKQIKWYKGKKPPGDNDRDVFMFLSGSADKPPGKGVGEVLHDGHNVMYKALHGMKNWRKVLSNFWVCPFEYDGKTYNSAEHAYHAEKFRMVAEMREEETASKYAEKFQVPDEDLSASEVNFSDLKGSDVKKKGGSRSFAMYPDEIELWGKISEFVLQSILEQKFSQCPLAKDVLLATGDSVLVHSMGRCGVRHHWDFLEDIRQKLRQ